MSARALARALTGAALGAAALVFATGIYAESNRLPDQP
jgi:hypothetical protein